MQGTNWGEKKYSVTMKKRQDLTKSLGTQPGGQMDKARERAQQEQEQCTWSGHSPPPFLSPIRH